jgi:hypothetical protein
MCTKMTKKHVEKTRNSELPIVNSATVACSDEVILPTIIVKIPGKDGRKRTVRALVDSGSQRSHILRPTADKFETADEYMRSNMYYGSGYFSMLDICTPAKDSGNRRRKCRWGFEKSSRWEHLQNWRK